MPSNPKESRYGLTGLSEGEILELGCPSTVTELKSRCKILNLACTSTGWGGEYKINYKDGKEATAYYASDLEDAWDTAKAFVRILRRQEEAILEAWNREADQVDGGYL
jgi:hypothetical protein